MKIDKSKLMKTAWEIARDGAKIFGGLVRSFFAESLKQAWGIAKDLTAALIKIGREWKKGNHHRIYFNDMTQYVNTDGMRSWQKRDLAGHSIYYEVNEKVWYRSPEIKDFFKEIESNILAKI